jgi:hypothetical protein
MSREVWIHRLFIKLGHRIGWPMAASLIFVILLIAGNPLMMVEGRQAARQEESQGRAAAQRKLDEGRALQNGADEDGDYLQRGANSQASTAK